MKANIKPSDTLHLVLKGKWFCMIASGKKKDEYREITPYWMSRIENKQFKYVCFHLGYTNVTMTFEIKLICIGIGLPEWGAPTDRNIFIIKLGKRIK